MNRLLILLVATMLAGCASTGSQKAKPSPELPPLPPGFKAGREITKASTPAARFAPASVPTVTPGTGIMQAPEIFNDPDFGRIFLARAYQGPNTELHVTGSTDFLSWSTVAYFGCWPSEQIFLVVTSASTPYRFMRGAHIPCAPTFQPASAVRLGAVKEFTYGGKRLKAAKLEGADVADGVTLWKVLP